MNNVFAVTVEQLFEQVAEGSATTLNGVCQTWLDEAMLVLTEDGPRPAQQAVWYLDGGEWAPTIHTLCETPGCLVLAHLTDDPAKVSAAKDEELLVLVERNSTSLASLYRKAKNRGLLSSRSSYQ